jgi:monofunctional glycosyltransferase
LAKRRKKKRLKIILRKLLRFGMGLAVLLVIISLIQVTLIRYINPPFTTPMVWDYFSHKIESKPYTRPKFVWRPIEKISPHLQRAVLAAEDQRFPDHHGFDVIEIRKAVSDMINANRVRGASTISMQTARSVYLVHTRNIFRKALEAYYTVLIELIWSKKRILEVYLNTVDWGTGVLGAEAASQTYFKKHANQLTAKQAALLSAILPSPHRLSPVKPDSYVKKRAKRILADMHLMPIL